jgi:hypothetical protein
VIDVLDVLTLSPPFSLEPLIIVVMPPGKVAVAMVYVPGIVQADIYISEATQAEVYVPGVVVAEVYE